MRLASFCIFLALLSGCGHFATPQREIAPEITVAAAANLTDVFQEIGRAFEREQGIHVVYSFGATANLTLQIENGGPFDLFASADTSHVDQLQKKGLVVDGSRAIYARGRLVLWVPPGGKAPIATLKDLELPSVRVVAIAKPEAAPYGKAAVESLEALKLWEAVEPKVVYAENIQMARQYAQSGNADAAFTAYSLTLNSGGKAIPVEESLHAPVDQALGVLKSSKKQEQAGQFAKYILGPRGRSILSRFGYLFP